MTEASTLSRLPQKIRPSRRKQLNSLFSHGGIRIGVTVLGLYFLLALLAPLLTPHDPYSQVLSARLLPPVWADGGSWTYLLGTDHLGRDYLTRLLYGGRVSMTIGLLAATCGCVIGTTLGICAGYFGGRVDQAANFLLTCQLAMPTLLLAMALVFLIGPSLPVVIAVIGLLHWTYFFVVVRAATMQLREAEFVHAARCFGSSRRQILMQEILPNLVSRIIVVFTLEVAVAMLAEASLSFLGVGVPPPTPSWGLMIAEGRNFMFMRPELVIIPGATLFVLIVAINLMGDGMRDLYEGKGH